jgi:phage protein D
VVTTAAASIGLKPKLSVDGTPLADDHDRLLTEMVLDDSVSLPDMLDLTFADDNAGFLERSPFKIGAKVKVVLNAPGQAPSTFEGECVGLGAQYHGGKFQATVRAFDISHRLNRGRMTKTYQDQTASDIVGSILGEHGVVRGKIEPTTVKFPFLTVANETPFAFLRRLAAEHGLEAVAADNKMHFRKPESTTEPIVLTPGGALLSLDIEVSAADQVKDIVVAGWDPKQKKEIVGRATAASKAAKINLKPEAIATKMGTTKKLVIGGLPIETQAHANAVAKATAEQQASAFIDVRGTISGHTALRAGGKIKLEGVGKDLGGEFVLSNTRHIWNQHAGYVTEFTVSGQQDRSLGGLVHGAAAASSRSISGVVTGIVTDNKDPDKLGKVRVALPWLDA